LATEVVRIARDKIAQIPTKSERVWKVVRHDGERLLDLRYETRKDYDLFMAIDLARLENLPVFASIQQKVNADGNLRKAFLIADGGDSEHISLRYVIPVINEILLKLDAGQLAAPAMALVLNRFDEYMSSQTTKSRVIAPLLNFTAEMVNVEIQDGVYLREFIDDELQDHCSAATLFVGSPYLQRLLPIRFKLEAAFEQPRVFGHDMTPSGLYQKRLDDTLIGLRLLRAGAVGFSFMKHEVDDVAGKSTAWTMGYSGQYYLHGDQYDFREHSLSQIPNILANLPQVANDRRFKLAMDRLMGVYVKPPSGDRLVDYWIGLEALMTPDKATELSYRASLRTAHLVSDASSRKQTFEFLRDSYNERSKFVHGSKSTVNDQTVSRTEDYLRKVLLYCVNNHKVPSEQELDSLVLGVGA